MHTNSHRGVGLAENMLSFTEGTKGKWHATAERLGAGDRNANSYRNLAGLAIETHSQHSQTDDNSELLEVADAGFEKVDGLLGDLDDPITAPAKSEVPSEIVSAIPTHLGEQITK